MRPCVGKECSERVRENRWKRGSCKASAQDLRTVGPIPSIFMALEVSSAGRALNMSVAEKMSLRVMGGGVCMRAMRTELGGLIVNTK